MHVFALVVHDAYLWMYWISKTPYQDQGRCHDYPGRLIYPVVKCDPLGYGHSQYAFDRRMPVNTGYRLFFTELEIGEGLVFLEKANTTSKRQTSNQAIKRREQDARYISRALA